MQNNPEPLNHKDQYTIEEMMERLINNTSTVKEREIVTRADGSQVLRVTKRKRRSKKDHKQKNKNYLPQIIAVLAFVFLIGLTIGISVIYGNSSAFRKTLLSKIEKASNAKAEMQQFRLNPIAAKANIVSLSWPEGSLVDKAEIQNVSAKISPIDIVRGHFGGKEIVAALGHLALQLPNENLPKSFTKDNEPLSSIHFSRYFFPSLDVRFGSTGILKKTQLTVYPNPLKKQTDIRLEKGTFQFPDWPAMDIERSYILAEGEKYKIQNLQLKIRDADSTSLFNSKSKLFLSGTLDTQNLQAPCFFKIKLEDFSVATLAGDDLAPFFIGQVNTQETASNSLRFHPKSPQKASIELAAEKDVDSSLTIKGFKFLPLLANAFNSSWYENPHFSKRASMRIKRTGNLVTISEIDFLENGRMAIKGSISNGINTSISGKLKIGIPENIITDAEDEKLSKMFTQSAEGFLWTEIEINGSSSHPKDNFLSLYMAKGLSSEKESEQKSTQDSFKELIEGN